MPTDLQRIILGVSVFAMGYLLVLEWNNDYGNQVAVSDAPAIQTTVSPDAPVTIPEGDAPPVLTTETQPETADGAPAWVEQDAPTAAAELQVAPEIAAAPGSLIRVTTDTQQLLIDPSGGGIVDLRLLKYPIALEQPDRPLPLFERSRERTYIAQNGVIRRERDPSRGPLVFGAAQPEFELGDNDELVVPLVAREDGLVITKRYIFKRDSYRVGLEISVENQSEADVRGALYAQIKRDASRPVGEVSMFLGPQPWLGGAVVTPDDPYERIDFDDMDEGPFSTRMTGGWIALVQHYFVGAWVPEVGTENRYYGERLQSGQYRLGFVGPAATVAPGETGTFSAALYAGPKIKRRLDATAEHLGLTVDYGILYWVAEPIFWLLSFIQEQVGNWGVAIILLTFVIKLILYPLSEASYRSLAGMKKVAPEMKRLQERYKEDKQKLQQEMMALYQREKVNPFGGCLPILLQMPVFIALYWVLYEAVELRQAPFFLWIVDLSVMDPLFILPIAMGATMFLMQMLNPPPPDPVQAQVMRVMPIAFTFLFLFFPAGLVLYWLVNNMLSIAQQWLVTRRIEGAAAAKKAQKA